MPIKTPGEQNYTRSPIAGLLLLLALSVYACADTAGGEITPVQDHSEANVNVSGLEEDFLTWWTYFNDSITLSDDFTAFDSSMTEMGKEDFIEALTTGNYIPLRLDATDGSTRLKLHALSPGSDERIASTIRNKSETILGQLQMEGSEFPEFVFNTLDGPVLTNSNTRGKILIVKCWFIGCQACIEEFPELNEIVEQYGDRSDIEFVSLAFDAPEALHRFLQKRDFSYQVASVDGDFIESDLQVYNYPTHIVVDKEGNIKKVVNSVNELKSALEKAL